MAVVAQLANAGMIGLVGLRRTSPAPGPISRRSLSRSARCAGPTQTKRNQTFEAVIADTVKPGHHFSPASVTSSDRSSSGG
jgi:hypothetical protein